MDDVQEQPAPPAPAEPPAPVALAEVVSEPPAAEEAGLPTEPGDRLAAGMLIGIAACLLLCAALVLIAAGRA